MIRDVPWKQPLTIGAVVAVAAFSLNLSAGDLTAASVVNPIGFGIMTFTVLSSLDLLATNNQHTLARSHPLLFALIPALATWILLMTLRVLVLSFDAEGPWENLAESALDISFRALAVYAIVAGSGLYL